MLVIEGVNDLRKQLPHNNPHSAPKLLVFIRSAAPLCFPYGFVQYFAYEAEITE